MKNENIRRLINQYVCNMNLLREDDKRYTIIVDYDAIDENLVLTINDGDSYSMVDKNNYQFNLTMSAKCNSYEANFATEFIRDNFIANHSISIPEIGPMYFNNNMYNCHHLKNTRFDLIISLNNYNDYENAYIAQEKAKRKIKCL